MNQEIGSFYELAEFHLDVTKRSLIRQGEPVALRPKVFDTLLFFVQNSGHILENKNWWKPSGARAMWKKTSWASTFSS